MRPNRISAALLVIAPLTASLAGAEPFAATATSTPQTWKRYELRGLQLGMTRTQLKSMGYTCGATPYSHCFKIMDDRCKTGQRRGARLHAARRPPPTPRSPSIARSRSRRGSCSPPSPRSARP